MISTAPTAQITAVLSPLLMALAPRFVDIQLLVHGGINRIDTGTIFPIDQMEGMLTRFQFQ